MIENLYKVPKRQWKKWSEDEQVLFNDLYRFMLYNQRTFIHPQAMAEDIDHWKTTAWNAAWMAADFHRTYRKAL